MAKGFLPSSDQGLLAWAKNFGGAIAADPAAYGLSVVQSDEFQSKLLAYSDALSVASSPGTRTVPSVNLKNVARAALRDIARRTASIIRGQAVASEAQQIEIGLTVRRNRSLIPAPDAAPLVSIAESDAIKITINLAESHASGGHKPAGILGAIIFAWFGDVAPTDLGDWRFMGTTSRRRFDLKIPSIVSPGTKVWISACWINMRAQPGPLSAPISSHAQFGALRLAA